MRYIEHMSNDRVIEILKEQMPEFLNSENTEQAANSLPLIGDTSLLGTGCSSFASGSMENKEFGAEPLGHKIESEKSINRNCGTMKSCHYCKGDCTMKNNDW